MNERYAVFGNPIAQSKSPDIHAAFAASLGQQITYTRELAPVDGFAASLRAFIESGGKGANVTAPFKLEAFQLATRASEGARRAGAANALKFVGNDILAENFDGVGLVNDIQNNLRVPIAGKRVLLLGAGGAARGAILPLLDAKPDVVVVANRTLTTALTVAESFFGYGTIEAVAPTSLRTPFDIVLNSTSASLYGQCPEVSTHVFGPQTLAYELVYGKGLTPFLQLAQQHGVRSCADGVGMLVEQAALAYEWWRSARPTTRPVIDAMTVPLTPLSV